MSNNIEIGKVYQVTEIGYEKARYHVLVSENGPNTIRGKYSYLSECVPGKGRVHNEFIDRAVILPGAFHKANYTFKLLKQKKLKCRK